MPLLETLVTGIGAAVAKGVLKMWLKDDPIVLSASVTAADILKGKIEDIRKRNAAGRELAAIGDRSAASFEQLIEKEQTPLDEADVETIANSAAEVINNTELTADLLTQNNLDPSDLAEFFLTRTGAQGGNPGLAEHDETAQRDLYKQLLLHASQQIVDISSGLPRFSERVISEILKRENRIYDVALRVLDGMDKLLAAQAGDDPDAERFETNYRQACIRRLDQLELFGVDLDESNKRYKLSVAYVTLEIEKTRIDDADDNDSDDDDEPDDGEFRDPVPVDEALAKATRLLVRGPAGSGKTTLIQWAAVFCAARDHEGELETFNELVPFVIKLRDFDDSKLPAPNRFAEVVAPATGGEPPGWSHRILESGRAIVLIDGLDEAAEDQRANVKTWLQDLLSQYPKSRYVVTTRPHAVDEGWLDGDEFVDASLQDMSHSDIARFVEHWHEAVATGLEEQDEKNKLKELSAALTKELKTQADLAKLATSPLLCAMICALHRDRVQTLPRDRIELYRACIEMFFRRDDIREIEMSDYVELTDRQRTLLLQSFAWWMIRNDKSSATPAEAYERFDRALGELHNGPENATGEDVATLFIQRAAILRQFAAEKIDFVHRTFQEFLAAQEALAENDRKLLVDNAEKEQWREVAILAAGMIANGADAEEFVLAILKRGDVAPKYQQTLYLIGAAALEAAQRLPKESTAKAEVSKRLEKILPPKSTKAAAELAKAGNLVVPLLAYDRRRRAHELALSVRVLALVNTPQALSVLLDYLVDNRTTVIRQCGTCLQFVDDDVRPEMARRVLAANLKRSGLADTAVSIRLRDCPVLYDCSSFVNCQSLQTLALDSCRQLSDVSGLANCQSLQFLDLCECRQLSEVNGLGNCKNLETLILYGCSKLSDVSGLANCQSLQSLDLSHCHRLSDVSSLGNCPSLQRLDLTNCRRLSDVSVLANSRSLQALHLSGCRQLSGVSKLENCESLQTLKLSGLNQLSDVSDLANFRSLRELDLSFCLWLCDVSALENCRSLETLDIRMCPDVSAQSIAELKRRLPGLKVRK